MSKAKEIYAKAVESFLDELKAGKNPFADIRVSYNLNTLREYSGFNQWYLSKRSKELGSDTSAWLTMNQINAKGGRVKKGSKSSAVFNWGFTYHFNNGGNDYTASAYSVEDALKIAKKKCGALTKGSFTRKIPYLKLFLVFELSQTEGLENIEIPQRDVMEHNYLLEHCGAQIETGGFDLYDEVEDVVVLSEHDADERYCEYAPLIAWCGHKDRLDHQHEFAKQKLVEQFGQSLLCGLTGTQDGPLKEEYVLEWLALLEKNEMFLWKACGDASKAVQLLMDNVASALQAA